MNALLSFIVSTTVGEKVLLNRVPTLLMLSSCLFPVVKRPLSVSDGLMCVRKIKIKQTDYIVVNTAAVLLYGTKVG